MISTRTTISALAALAIAAMAFQASRLTAETAALKAPSEFDTIADASARSAALFTEAGKVIQHPRCVNCHPAGDIPRQGDARRLHEPHVVRGDGGMGAPGLRCTTCHGAENFDPGHVPGNPTWHLAPAETAWEGKTLGQICEQVKDPKRNTGLNMDQLVKHMAEDPLVGWAWNPGAGRQPAPGSQQAFGALIKAWAATGAACPKS